MAAILVQDAFVETCREARMRRKLLHCNFVFDYQIFLLLSSY
jgi:hypothetical protein